MEKNSKANKRMDGGGGEGGGSYLALRSTFSEQPLIRFRIVLWDSTIKDYCRVPCRYSYFYQSINQFIQKYSHIGKQLLRGVLKWKLLKDVLNTYVAYSISSKKRIFWLQYTPPQILSRKFSEIFRNHYLRVHVTGCIWIFPAISLTHVKARS